MGSIIEGYNYDVFISYRQKDNKGDRWVSEFVEALKTELDATFKEEISVYFDINPHDGLLETHDVSDSLKEKLKCLIFIPVISRTYCDPHSFAWEHEFKAFVELASSDSLGLKVRLPNGNVATRVLPVKIHELDRSDQELCENVLGGALRGIDFIYKSPGVNRPLRINEDNPRENLNHTYYRDQVNKASNAIKEIIDGIRSSGPSFSRGPANEKLKEQGIGILMRMALRTRETKVLLLAAIILIIIVSLALYYNEIRNSGRKMAIALLPLRNYGDDALASDASNFAEIINGNLRLIENVSIASAISMLQYSNTDKSPEEICKALKLNYLLAGNIKRDAGIPVIWIELSDAKTNHSVWTGSYKWEKEQIPVITRDLISNIVNNIDLNLTTEDLRNFENELTENSEANIDYFSANAMANDATFYYYYGNKLRDSISFISAIKSYDKAIERDPEFAEAYARRSIAISWGLYTRQIDSSYITQSRADAEKAVKLKQHLPEGHIAFGFYYYYCVKNEPRKALEHFRKAAELDPGDYHPVYYMALVHRRIGEWDESMRLLRDVIRKDPSEALFLTNIGISYDYLHKYDSAAIYYDKAIEFMPGWTAAYLNKVTNALQRTGNTTESWVILNTAIRKTGQEFKDYKIMLFMLDGNYDKALHEASILPQESVETGEKYLHLAVINDELKKDVIAQKYYDSAAVVFKKTREFYPEDPGVHMSLAFCYAGTRDIKQAIAASNKAIELSKDNNMVMSDMRLNYAHILINVGRYDAALDLLELLLASPSPLSVKSLEMDPVYQPLAENEKFIELIRKYSYN